MNPGGPANFAALREELTIGPMTVRNRIMMAPMERNYAHPDGSVSARTLAHYGERAAGGVGWVDVEATFVASEGRGRVNQLGLHSGSMVSGFEGLVSACHAHGAKVSVELHHAGRHASRQVTGLQPVAPGALPSDESGGELSLPLDAEGVRRVIGAYREAARRAIDAGVDAVELHGAHGYLVHQFLSPLTNSRDDEFGGSDAKRQEFAVRAVAALREAVADEPVAVGCRLSVTEAMVGGFSEEFIAGLGHRLRDEGADYLSLNAGAIDSPQAISPPMGSQRQGWLAPVARRLRSEWGMPVVLAGRFLDLDAGEAAVRDGAADVVAYGRALLADPEMVNKSLRGDIGAITPCIGCNQGCVARIGQQLDATCTVNPRMGRELLSIERRPSQASDRSTRLTVVGGGPAGIVAALEADAAGFNVDLFEASGQLGGNLRYAEAAPGREGWGRYRAYLEARIAISGVRVQLDTLVGTDELRATGEILILATGARPVMPAVLLRSGSAPRLFTADEAVNTPQLVGARCLILGGDATAVGTALALIQSDIDIAALIGSPASSRTLGGLEVAVQQLEESGCEFLPGHEVTWANEDEVGVSSVGAIADIENRTFTMIDSVIVCSPRVPGDLPHQLSADFAETHRVGDASYPGDAREAVADAYDLVRDLSRRFRPSHQRSARRVPNVQAKE